MSKGTIASPSKSSVGATVENPVFGHAGRGGGSRGPSAGVEIELTDTHFERKRMMQQLRRESSADAVNVFRSNVGEAVALKAENPEEANDKALNFMPGTTKCVLNPSGRYMKRWDIFILCALVYTAFVTPFEVAFLDPHLDALFVVDRLIDLTFITDMVFQFYLAYQDPKDGQWILARSRIASRYLRGWFTIDVVSVLPFDTVGLLFDSRTIASLKALRMVRLLRLLKLLRIVRASRLLKRWEAHLSFTHARAALVKFLIYIVVISHWMACMLRLTAAMEGYTDAAGQPRSWIIYYANIDDPQDPVSVYISAFYWAGMTVTTIGYGDIVPTTPGEHVCVIAGMFVGAGTFAYLVGAICGILASMDAATLHYNKELDKLNYFAQENRLPPDLQLRLRQYFIQCKDLIRAHYFSDLYPAMSNSLRREVAVFINYEWTRVVPLFAVEEVTERHDFISALSMHLKRAVFAPREYIYRVGEPALILYIVQVGLATNNTKFLGPRSYCGEEFVLKGARRLRNLVSVSYVTTFTIHRDDLYAVLDTGNFPSVHFNVKTQAIKVSFRAALLNTKRNYDYLLQTDPTFPMFWRERTLPDILTLQNSTIADLTAQVMWSKRVTRKPSDTGKLLRASSMRFVKGADRKLGDATPTSPFAAASAGRSPPLKAPNVTAAIFRRNTAMAGTPLAGDGPSPTVAAALTPVALVASASTRSTLPTSAPGEAVAPTEQPVVVLDSRPTLSFRGEQTGDSGSSVGAPIDETQQLVKAVRSLQNTVATMEHNMQELRNQYARPVPEVTAPQQAPSPRGAMSASAQSPAVEPLNSEMMLYARAVVVLLIVCLGCLIGLLAR